MRRLLTVIGCLLFLPACSGEIAQGPPPPPLDIVRIATTAEPIIPGEEIPPFLTFFETGTTVVYSYVWIANTETMTGSFPVRMRWFSPNDLRPPIAHRDITLEPGQSVAQFSIHNESGHANSPYKIIARTGKDLSSLTASGSHRFYIGVSEQDAQIFLEQEAEYLQKREEERRKRKEEEERKKAEEEMTEESGAEVDELL